MMIKGSLKERLSYEFPDEWELSNLKKITEKVIDNRGKTPPLDENGEYPLLEIFNMKENTLKIEVQEKQKYVNSETYTTWFRNGHPNYGDILVSTVGNVGVVSYYDQKNFGIAQNVIALNLKKDIVSNRFIAYFLKSSLFKKWIKAVTMNAVQPSLKVPHLLEGVIPLPPIKEQQKIAAILSSVDEAIEKTEQIIEQTEKVKKGLMQELLTKGIGHTEFKDTPVGKIPEEWEVLNFNDVFDRITTKNEVDNQNVLTISGEHGLISQLEYFNKSVSSKNLRNYIYLEKGDFAYNKSYSNGYPLGAIKRLERYDVGVVSTLYICFRLKESYIDGFYKYYFDSPYWHRQVYSIAPEGGRSHGLLNVGVRDFFEILIPVPPIEEQEKINNTIYSIDQKIIKENNRLINLSNIKKGLMQELLTGKKRVKIDDSEEILS